MRVRAFAPGRINLIGDHTDHTHGFVLPMAIELGTTVEVERGGDRVVLRSDRADEPAEVPLDVQDPASVRPAWAAYVAGVVAELRPPVGATGTVRSTVPLGAGLSSSASLTVAVALALGHDGEPRSVAELCQRAEQRASGVPCGIMDQLTAAAGVEGSLLLIDCRSLEVRPVPLPGGVAVVAVDSGQQRALAASGYAERRRECEEAEALIGPLRHADPADVESLPEPLRRRARHVVTENRRVLDAVAALAAGDVAAAGQLMVDSHRSLADDFEVSTPQVDAVVERLLATPGVLGARMTGGGFGGMVVALVEEGVDPVSLGGRRLHPSAGARVEPVG